jgi:hypothetical protein
MAWHRALGGAPISPRARGLSGVVRYGAERRGMRALVLLSLELGLALALALVGGCAQIAEIHAGKLVTEDSGPDGTVADTGAKPDGSVVDSGRRTDAGSDALTPDSATDSSAVDSTLSDTSVTDSGSPLDSTIADSGEDSAMANDGAMAPDSAMNADSAHPADDAGACTANLMCTPSACQYGVTACEDAGGPAVCQMTGISPVGTSCNSGAGVCDDAGTCNLCALGQDCSEAGSCARMTIACSTGVPTCTSAGNQPNGTSCGTNRYCDNGVCGACVQNNPCNPPGEPCTQGGFDCTGPNGPVCNGNGPEPNGTSCGANMVCNGGTCVSCTAMQSCTPQNPCDLGMTSCATGTMACLDTGMPNTAANGTACMANAVCDNGNCASCAAGTSCNLVAPANICDTGQIACGTGTPVCTDTHISNPAANGTPCGAGEVCDNGVCTACATGQSCTPTNPCHTGTISCTTGSPVCVDSENMAPNGTACPTASGPQACYNGVCECNFTGLVAYYTFDGNANDLSGNGYNATATDVSYVPGFFGQAVHPNGTSSLIQASGSYMFSGPRTFCAWIQVNSLTVNLGQPVIVGGAALAGDFLGYQPASGATNCSATIPANNLYLDNWGSVGCEPDPSLAVTPSANFSNFVCFDFEGGGGDAWTFYVNGGFDDFSELNGSNDMAPYNWALSTVTIGTNDIGGTSTSSSNGGALDEVSMWGRGLTITEMNALYNDGMGCHVH